MKSLLIALFGLFSVPVLKAQQPVEWLFFSKKINNNTYEIHLAATIDKGWYVYSKASSQKGPSPLSVTILPVNNLKVSKGVKEEGTPIKKKNVEGINTQYFENTVGLIQTVTVSGSVSELVKGSVSYVAASASQTLPPQTVEFSLILNQE